MSSADPAISPGDGREDQRVPERPARAVPLAYTDVGEGMPIVLCHGGFNSRSTWRLQIPELARDHRVVAVDLPGHGESAAEPPDCTVIGAALSVVELLASLSLEDAVIVGHSFGTRVALEVAARAPERIRGVVLIDGSRIKRRDSAATAASLTAELRAHPQATLRRVYEEQFIGSRDPAVRKEVLDGLSAFSADTAISVIGSAELWERTSMDEALGALRAKVLALESTDMDEMQRRFSLKSGARTSYIDALEPFCADLEVVIVEDASHYVMFDAPQTVTETIARFAEEVR